MAKVMSAEAIISARDATGGVFESIAGRMRRLANAGQAVSGAQARFAAFADTAERTSKKLTAVGRGMTVGLTIPAALAAGSIYGDIRRFEFASNKLKAFGEMTDEQVAKARALAQEVGKNYAFGPAGVLEGMVESIKAGFEPRHLAAIQKPLLDFATLAEIDVPKAAELAIFSLAGFGKMFDKTGKMLGDAEVNQNLRQMVDLFAVLNKVAPGDIRGISETFKYSAAAAKNLKVAPEQLGAFTAVMAQAGILGPEAGVALRSMMVRFLKPTRPALAALSAVGMNLSDYVLKDTNLLKPDSVVSAIEQQTGTLDANKRAALRARIAGLEGMGGEGYEKGLLAAIQSTGAGGLADADVAGKLVTSIVGMAIEKIDIMKFLKDASEKAPNFGAFMAQFMDQRQAVRAANLDSARVTQMLVDMEKSLADARSRGASVSQEMAATINSGLIGSENRLRGSWQNFIQALAKSGVVESLARMMDGAAAGLTKLSEVNPRLIEFGTYAVAATAALGPLVLLLGKLAAVAGGAARVAAAISGLGGAGAGAVGTGAAAAGAAGTSSWMARSLSVPWLAAALQQATQRDLLTTAPGGRGWREVMLERGHRAEDGSFKPLTLESVHAALGAANISAELKGAADVNVKVSVEPSPDFMTRIKNQISNAIGNLRINGGTPDSGTAGSTGKSMPQVGPAP